MNAHIAVEEEFARRIANVNARKRVFDLVVASSLAPVAFPIMFVVSIALMVRQGRPVLYSQERLGYHEQVFRIYKFRTMTDARDDQGRLLPDAQRLTAIGRFLRKTSLDELPQLINILRGEMSIIGPRPLFPRYLPFYTQRERMRHLVRPGVTGWAQVHGRNFVGWDARFELDVEYVERLSLYTDLLIILKTIKRIVLRTDIAVVAGTSGRPLDVARTYPSDDTFSMRALRLEDLDVRVKWMNDPATREYMRLDDEITLESTIRWFESSRSKSGRHDFVVEDRETGEVVALSGLRERGPRRAESYIMVKPGSRGRGIGARSQRFLLEWAFNSGLYDTVISNVRRDNAASYRMHTKFGGTIVKGKDGRDDIVVDRDTFMREVVGDD
jgi:lipopolysaccharide/colanic/teichoic acid biosynthesis glycosyltransferase/RimJ/RimL family protein N-acetyltransferase